MPKRSLLLLAVLLIVNAPARAVPTLEAPAAEGTVYATPAGPAVAGLAKFAAWSRSAQGMSLLSGRKLMSFHRLDLAKEADAQAVTPLLEELSDAQIDRLASIDQLEPSERSAALDQLEAAVGRAEPKVTESAKEAVRRATAKGSKADWSRLAASLKSLSIYGDWAGKVSDMVQQRADLVRTTHNTAAVQKTARSLEAQTASARIVKVEDNVIHVDFKAGKNGAPHPTLSPVNGERMAEGQVRDKEEGAVVIQFPTREQRTPPVWAVKERAELKRMINNTEVIGSMDVSAVVNQRNSEQRREYVQRLRALEADYPRLRSAEDKQEQEHWEAVSSYHQAYGYHDHAGAGWAAGRLAQESRARQWLFFLVSGAIVVGFLMLFLSKV